MYSFSSLDLPLFYYENMQFYEDMAIYYYGHVLCGKYPQAPILYLSEALDGPL